MARPDSLHRKRANFTHRAGRLERIGPRSSLDLSNDPSVVLYRATKAARAQRPDPRLAEARQSYLRAIDTQNSPGRSGRTKAKPQTWEIEL